LAAKRKYLRKYLNLVDVFAAIVFFFFGNSLEMLVSKLAKMRFMNFIFTTAIVVLVEFVVAHLAYSLAYIMTEATVSL